MKGLTRNFKDVRAVGSASTLGGGGGPYPVSRRKLPFFDYHSCQQEKPHKPQIPCPGDNLWLAPLCVTHLRPRVSVTKMFEPPTGQTKAPTNFLAGA